MSARTLADPKYRAELEREANKFMEKHNAKLRYRGSDVGALSLDAEIEDGDGAMEPALEARAIRSHGRIKETDPRYRAMLEKYRASDVFLAYPAAGDEMGIEEREELSARAAELAASGKVGKTFARLLRQLAAGEKLSWDIHNHWLKKLEVQNA